jgi:predicted glycoside hydrolase/deacetylase ChbG (UPF0249 family)
MTTPTPNTAEPAGLVVRADDFGASPGTNDAILAAAAAGHVLNIGVMAPAPFLEHRWNDLLDIQENACVGVHATINSEWHRLRWGPLSPDVPGLVEADGTFHRTTQATAGSARVEEIVREIRAQIESLRRRGLRPRYLDTHMGFQWIPGVEAALDRLCASEGLVFAQSPQFAHFRYQLPQGGGFQPDALDQALLETGDPLLVWIFHPAHRDAISDLFYPGENPSADVAMRRACEAALLEDPRFVNHLRHMRGFRLLRYDEAGLIGPRSF